MLMISNYNSCLLKERELDETLLAPEEIKLSQKFKDERRRTHFLLGRAAAKNSLAKAGYLGKCAILQGTRGEALWPAGYCGSISHCTETKSGEAVALALADSTKNFRSLGVDIECLAREVAPGIDMKLGTELEFNALKGKSHKELMLLSGKEALFKLLYPLSRTFFGFLDAELIWNEKEQIFNASLKKELNPEFTSAYELKIACDISSNYIICSTSLS